MKIREDTLQDILNVSKEAYPREAGGILLGKEQIDDFVLIPGQFNPSSIQVKLNNLPIYTDKKGTFHSHPTPNSKPSQADRSFFSRMGRYHLIIPKPYNQQSVRAYNNKGEQIDMQVMEE